VRALVSLLFVLLLAQWSNACAPPARLTPQQEQLLKQRNALWQQGQQAWQQGKHAEAVNCLERVLDIHLRVLGLWHRATEGTAAQLAVWEAQCQHWEQVVGHRRRVLEARRRLDGRGHWRTVDARWDLRLAEAAQGWTEPRRRRWSQSEKDIVEMIRHYQAGHPARALAVAKQMLKARGDLLDQSHPVFATSLNNLAFLYHATGQHKQALPLYRRVVEIYKTSLGQDHPRYALSLNNLAGLSKDMGEHRDALTLYRRSLEIYKAALGQTNPDYALGLNNLAGLSRDVGDYRQAQALYKQALEVTRATLGEKHPDYALSLNNLAYIYKAMGEYKEALPLYKLALEIRKAVLPEGHPDCAQSLNNLAMLYLATGEHKQALPLFNETLEINRAAHGEKHPDYALSLNNLAGLFEAMGQHKQALSLCKQALELRRVSLGEKHPEYADSLSNLAWLYRAVGEPRQAANLQEQALGLAWSHLEACSAGQSERVQLAQAAHLRHRVDGLLSLPSAASVSAAEQYGRVLAWKGAVLLRQRHRRLFARLARSRPEVAQLAADLEQTTRLLASLALAPVDARTGTSRREQMERLTQKKEELEGKLAGAAEEFRRARLPVGPAEILACLPADTVLVDFLFFARGNPGNVDPNKRWRRWLTAFVLRKGKPVLRLDLGPAEPVEQAVTAWRQNLVRRGGRGGKAGQTLRQLLWQPLEKHLAGAKTVLVSPDGALGTLSFVALPGSKEGTYLIEDVAVAVMPVPQHLPELLASVSREKRLKPSLLVVGDVNFDSAQTVVASADEHGAPRGALQSWGNLPATQAEAAAVKDRFSKLFPGGAVTDLRQGNARKSAVRQALSRRRYAHLATHGFFAPTELKSALADNRPGDSSGLFGREGVTGWHPLLLSGLVLAGANKKAKPGEEDGILTALEVSEMDLAGLDLMVLSACETGLGKQAGGEGLLGLQRAFTVAGCQSVVASLWQVPDEATQVLMTRFYDNLWRHRMSRLHALREAQRWLLDEGSRHPEVMRGLKRRGAQREDAQTEGKQTGRLPPLFWAAFVLSGNWR
jgi:CHAT domain-containing protein/Tfp pilus assembly protein PilF